MALFALAEIQIAFYLWLILLFSVFVVTHLQITYAAPVRVCVGLHDALPVLQPSSLGSRNLSHCHVHQLWTGEQNK